MTPVEILIYRKRDLTPLLKLRLALLMQEWEAQNHNLPPANAQYYELQLELPPELENDEIWAIGEVNDETIGYGNCFPNVRCSSTRMYGDVLEKVY